jgi:hypothetical protein
MTVLALTLASLLAAAPLGGGDVHASCRGAQAVDTTINGSTKHGDQISAAMAIVARSQPAGGVIAYEYQTYGGTEYIQFQIQFGGRYPSRLVVNGQGSAAIFPFHGNVYSAFREALQIAKTAQSTLPFPYSALSAKTKFNREWCKPRR